MLERVHRILFEAKKREDSAASVMRILGHVSFTEG